MSQALINEVAALRREVALLQRSLEELREELAREYQRKRGPKPNGDEKAAA